MVYFLSELMARFLYGNNISPAYGFVKYTGSIKYYVSTCWHEAKQYCGISQRIFSKTVAEKAKLSVLLMPDSPMMSEKLFQINDPFSVENAQCNKRTGSKSYYQNNNRKNDYKREGTGIFLNRLG